MRASLAIASLALLDPAIALAQDRAATAVVVAGKEYAAGSSHRKFFGNNYRDLWTAPIRVPLLDLQRTAGGLTPTETGGGNQTRSLRFRGGDGQMYVFRSVNKDAVTLPSKNLEGTIVEDIFRDIVSVHHPAASIIADHFFTAARVLHPHAVFRVMPDDPRLGKFREEFAGRLGNFEEYPDDGDTGTLFAGARKLIDSEDLLERLNEHAVVPIDAEAFLAARLVDMLLNNFDRHAGQWKWAQRGGENAPWEPISRDQDKVLVSYEGMFVSIARVGAPHLVKFEEVYPPLSGLTYNSLEFDRRLLTGLPRSTFTRVGRELAQRITNPLIDRALASAPPEYASVNPRLAALLKARRDLLPDVAERFYERLVAVADVHLSDEPEAVTVTRAADGSVTVEARGPSGATSFSRRFDPAETHDLRIHLHGGDDRAVVRGASASSIETRVIGGNGTNVLVDSSMVAGRAAPTRLYDEGEVKGIDYGKDTLWNRYPWVRYKGEWLPPGRTRGGGIGPVISVDVQRSLGFIGGIGIARTTYGYGTQPYSSRVEFLAEHSLGMGGTRLTLTGDKRGERTPVHFLATARMSDLEVVNYFGFGNTQPTFPDPFHEAHHRQWMLYPAMALDLRGPRSYVSLGPVVQYTTADSVAGSLIAAEQPYGFREFGQVGVRFAAVHESRGERKRLHTPKSGRIIEGSASWYPAAWDVESAYGRVGVSALNFITIPVPTRPILLLGLGGAKVWGDAPFHDAAFVGGRGAVHGFDLQRLAGDAALYATAELRVPVARFAMIVPIELGLFANHDVGRVYLDGESPGGWHRAIGAGVRLGIFGQFVNIRVLSRCFGPSPENTNINAHIAC